MSDSESERERSAQRRRALLHVVRGEPDDVEVAALTSVLTAASVASALAAAATDDEGGLSVWVDRRAAVRRPVHPGPGAWRTSTWPR